MRSSSCRRIQCRRALAAALTCATAALVGCHRQGPAANAKLPATQPDLERHAAIRGRALLQFDRADYCKPLCDGDERLECLLAPLILFDAPAQSRDHAVPPALPARLVIDDAGIVRPVADEFAVYASISTADLGGRPHAQIVYSWWSTSDVRTACALRITLDRNGYPAVWEAVSGEQQSPLIFVSQSLENATAREFGPPLPGRAFAVECPLDQAPDVVVTRVLADSPVPTGPIIYLDVHGHITGIICRCMPSQFADIGRTIEFRVEPIEVLAEEGFAGAASDGFLHAGALALRSDAPDLLRADHLARCLRLPRDW